MIRLTLTLLALAGAFATAPLQAQLLTDVSSLGSPTTTITDFGQSSTRVLDGYSAILPGPDNIRMSYTGADGLYFDFSGWGLGSNGTATGSSVGINQEGLLRFDFLAGPVGGVGLLMNYAPIVGSSVFLRALDASNNVLSQYDLTSAAPIVGNDFQFRGIAAGGISAFELEGVGRPSPIFRSLTYGRVVSVPEPGAMMLIAFGALALGVIGIRRREEDYVDEI